MSRSTAFYYRSSFVVFMLILFFPAGLVLMWKGNKFGKTSRIIISAIGLSLLFPLRKIKKQIPS